MFRIEGLKACKGNGDVYGIANEVEAYDALVANTDELEVGLSCSFFLVTIYSAWLSMLNIHFEKFSIAIADKCVDLKSLYLAT